MLKKIISLLGFIILLALLASLFILHPADQKNKKIKIATTTAFIQSMVKAIGGSNVESTLIIPNGSDIHNIQFTVKQKEIIKQSDFLFENGLGLEHGLKINKNVNKMVVSSGVVPIYNLDGSKNPHAYLDPVQIKIYLKNITQTLSRFDKTKSSFFESNYNLEIHKLDDLIQKYSNYKNKNIIVTKENSLAYLQNDFQFEYYFLQYTDDEDAQSISQTTELISKIKNKKKVLFLFDKNINDKALKAIQSENKDAKSKISFFDSLAPQKNYIQTIESNFQSIYSN